MRIVFLSSLSGGAQEKPINPPEEWDFRFEAPLIIAYLSWSSMAGEGPPLSYDLKTGEESWDI
jgi:hypothetical protein